LGLEDRNLLFQVGSRACGVGLAFLLEHLQMKIRVKVFWQVSNQNASVGIVSAFPCSQGKRLTCTVLPQRGVSDWQASIPADNNQDYSIINLKMSTYSHFHWIRVPIESIETN